jgi:hypothetical protein
LKRGKYLQESQLNVCGLRPGPRLQSSLSKIPPPKSETVRAVLHNAWVYGKRHMKKELGNLPLCNSIKGNEREMSDETIHFLLSLLLEELELIKPSRRWRHSLTSANPYHNVIWRTKTIWILCCCRLSNLKAGSTYVNMLLDDLKCIVKP